MKILVAEDNEVFRAVLETTLRKLGHEVVCAEDGQKAWKIFKSDYFPVVISDWLMPLADGLVLTHQIRKFERDRYSYVILLTALDGKANYLEAMKAGADDFLPKPLDREALIARIHVAERILGLHSYINRLEEMLPICSFCKRIHNEKNLWEPLEDYVGRKSETRFSHSICPECSVEFLDHPLEDEQL